MAVGRGVAAKRSSDLLGGRGRRDPPGGARCLTGDWGAREGTGRTEGEGGREEIDSGRKAKSEDFETKK